MFSLICVWINGWVNNGWAGDLRRYRAHYDVTVMLYSLFRFTPDGIGTCGFFYCILIKCSRVETLSSFRRTIHSQLTIHGPTPLPLSFQQAICWPVQWCNYFKKPTRVQKMPSVRVSPSFRKRTASLCRRSPTMDADRQFLITLRNRSWASVGEYRNVFSRLVGPVSLYWQSLRYHDTHCIVNIVMRPSYFHTGNSHAVRGHIETARYYV